MSRRTLAILAHYNITAVASGPPALVRAWQAAAPGRIIAGTSPRETPPQSPWTPASTASARSSPTISIGEREAAAAGSNYK